MVDDVIDPRETRIKIIQALEMLRNKEEIKTMRKNTEIFHCNVNIVLKAQNIFVLSSFICC